MQISLQRGFRSHTLNDVRMTANSALVTGTVKRSLVFEMLLLTPRKAKKQKDQMTRQAGSRYIVASEDKLHQIYDFLDLNIFQHNQVTLRSI